MNNFLRYPKTLSSGIHNTVIALSETEVAKLFDEDTRSDIGSEAEKMKFANQVNRLVVKFIRLDFEEEKKAEMPSDAAGFTFDNIFLTFTGLRLIDVGISALRSQVGEKLFKYYTEQELKEVALFKEFFLTR